MTVGPCFSCLSKDTLENLNAEYNWHCMSSCINSLKDKTKDMPCWNKCRKVIFYNFEFRI